MEESSKTPERHPAAGFPSTRMTVLKRAAKNEWQDFFTTYARACWTELVFQCRHRHIPIDEAEDLFQEFALRLLRPGMSAGAAVGNLPGRFLAGLPFQETPAMFRTFLKATIANVLREHLRRRAQNVPSSLPDDLACDAAIEQSVSRHAEELWLARRLASAVAAFREEAESARTKGKRREFSVLYSDVVGRVATEALAEKLGLARSTIAELLPQARSTFRRHLRSATGIEEADELKSLLQRHPDALVAAFRAFPPEASAPSGPTG
jgi:DNA-directed RNA polymerase specialized sigma24 family protein